MAKKLKRPTKEMMLAVNAQIDGDREEVGRLVQEHKLDQKDIQQRVQMRDGEKYSFEVKPRGPRKSKAFSDDILSMIDGRTPLVTVLRIEERARKIIARKADTPKQTATPTAAPGARPPSVKGAKQKKIKKEAQDRLARTGRIDDAVEAILHMDD